MPTLTEIDTDLLTPRDAKKSSASDEEIPLLSSEDSSESNDERKSNVTLEEKKISANGKVNVKSSKEKASADSKGKSRKRGGRQISIFESIGVSPPTGTTTTTPKISTGDTNADGSSKKKRKRTVITPKDDAFPICVHITAEGKEPKKVIITCHGIKSDFNEDIVASPIVLKEKLTLHKDPVGRFLIGFGRYIW